MPQKTREALKQAEEILDRISGKVKFKFKEWSLKELDKTKTENKENGTGTKG